MPEHPKTGDDWRRMARESNDGEMAAAYLAKAVEADRLAAAAPIPLRRKWTVADVTKTIQEASPAERAELRRAFGDVIPAAPASSAKVVMRTGPAPDLNKVAAAITPQIVEAASQAIEEIVKPYRDRLADLEKMATPGGPVRNSVRAPGRDRSSAAYFRRQAAATTDPALAAAYRERAAQLERAEDH